MIMKDEDIKRYAEQAYQGVQIDRAITVAELIDILRQCPTDAKVHCSTEADCSSTLIHGLREIGVGVVILQGF